MSRTYVPPAPPLNKKVDLKKVLKEVHYYLEINWGDLDKAGDVDDAAYYAGAVDAFWLVERWLTKRGLFERQSIADKVILKFMRTFYFSKP